VADQMLINVEESIILVVDVFIIVSIGSLYVIYFRDFPTHLSEEKRIVQWSQEHTMIRHLHEEMKEKVAD
jgi:hypothetical protein